MSPCELQCLTRVSELAVVTGSGDLSQKVRVDSALGVRVFHGDFVQNPICYILRRHVSAV
jgi:hypothetical protein